MSTTRSLWPRKVEFLGQLQYARGSITRELDVSAEGEQGIEVFSRNGSPAEGTRRLAAIEAGRDAKTLEKLVKVVVVYSLEGCFAIACFCQDFGPLVQTIQMTTRVEGLRTQWDAAQTFDLRLTPMTYWFCKGQRCPFFQ